MMQFSVSEIFKNKTVVVMGSGPSLTKELADSVRHLPRICARRAIRMAPDANMVVALDGYPNDGFWDELSSYGGLKICGKNDPRTGAFFIPFQAEIYQVNGKLKFMFNNGLAAIRLAELGGANEIILRGFDPLIKGSFYDNDHQEPGHDLYEGLDVMLNNIIIELNEKGIKCHF